MDSDLAADLTTFPAEDPALPPPGEIHRGALDRFFKLSQRRTSVRQELLAGLTTFAAMSYILAVNPAILTACGMDFGALISVTALSAAIVTAMMALGTNYPLVLAPGMGSNIFFAVQICLGMHIPWQAALGLTFWNGVLFVILASTGARELILRSIPPSLKIAITVGVGLFIALIGLRNGGVLVADPHTMIALGKVATPGCLLVLVGVVLNAVLIHRRVRGAMVLTILLLTVAGLFLPAATGQGMITPRPAALVSLPASIAPTFCQFDPLYLFKHFTFAFPIVLALFFVDLMGSMAVVLAVCQRGALVDRQGEVPRMRGALTVDALGASIGAVLGTSMVNTYIESAAGVEEGGRTGLTGLTVSACFLLALFFNPIIRVVPAVATAPALILVGVFMMQDIVNLPLRDLSIAIPALVTIILMPLSNVSDGIAIGLILHMLVMLGLGRAREMPVATYALADFFIAHFIFQ